MVSTKPKFDFLTSWFFLLSSVLILVSVSAAEELQCHWCGPLAEQVHRSRRSKRCDETNTEVTTCDPEYPYCAIVATSPPYVESRHCVKLYQDECYHIFCNTTKTWKMTCPCRGVLCNGPNTERELEAFQILRKLVAKTHKNRVKKALISTTNFIKGDNNRMKIVSNATEPDKNLKMNNTEIKNENKSQINDNVINTNSKDIDITKTQIAETGASLNKMSPKTLDIDNKKDMDLALDSKKLNDMGMQSDQPMNENTKNDSRHEYVEKIIIPLTTKGTTVLDKPATTATTIKFNEMDMNRETRAEKVKSSVAPTAEALQHNDNPASTTAKVSEDTTLTTTMTTTDDEDMYKPTIPGKNYSACLTLVNNFIFISSLILVYNFQMD